MSRTLHLFDTDWCAMMVPIQVIRWYRMQCYDGTDSCATVVPIRRYCHRAFGRCTGITFVDSTMIPICHNLRRYANKVFKGIATDGKGTMGWCHGFKLHLACNDRGEIIAFVLTGANV
ncbi:hypothetical protein PREVCOP_05874, partial [Segatella copri DSM 18205]